VLAALESVGLSLRAIDVGRLGSTSDATMDRVLKAVTSELSERRLAREWAQNPPDVALAFDPGSAEALVSLANGAVRSAPVVCVVPEVSPRVEWGRVAADRFLAVDDRAAANLGDAGVPDDKVIVVGPLAEARFAEVARKTRVEVREKFQIGPKETVVLVDVAGFGYDRASQVALQLALVEESVLFLFDAGDDTEAATALRAQVPTLDMRAKLFGVTDDEPELWRTADVVVASPTARAVARALAVGARMVCLADRGERGFGDALEERGRAISAASPLLISSALEPLLLQAKKQSYRAGKDGAQNVADIAFVVAHARQSILDEKQSVGRATTSRRVGEVARAAEASERVRRKPGELEDLGGAAGTPAEVPPVDPREVARLREKLELEKHRLEKSIAEANHSAGQWDTRREAALAEGGVDAARHAERNADLERARMHKALAELANIEAEQRRLEKAAHAPPPPPRRAPPPKRPAKQEDPVDEMLREMKRGAAPKRKKSGTRKKKSGSTVDDELAALKRKMKKGSKKT